MDQKKIGMFLKELRKEKELTQEELAERFRVSNRTISRWETGTNLPDISLLVEIAEFFDVSIPEIINGERKEMNMTQETVETAAKMAEYSGNEMKVGKKTTAGYLLMGFGIFIIIFALISINPDSSWGAVYSKLGTILAAAGLYLVIKTKFIKRWTRALTVIGFLLLMFALFHTSDYMAAKYSNQVPRFNYLVEYTSETPNTRYFETLFFTAVQQDVGTGNEHIEVHKKKLSQSLKEYFYVVTGQYDKYGRR